MIEETEIFERFHSALDAQPTPGAPQRLRAALLEPSVAARPAPAARRGVRISLRLVAGLALIAIAIASTGVFVALHRPAIRPAPAQPPSSHALARTTWGMVSPTVGWQQTSWFDQNGLHHILRTTDAGVHWTDVSPPDGLIGAAGTQEIGFVTGVYALDSAHLWITETVQTGPPFGLFTIRTSDGGRTWERGSAISITGMGGFWPSLYFVDSNHGWLLLRVQYASPSEVPSDQLYRTTDGGASWTEVAVNPWANERTCPWQQAAFASANDGWLSMGCPVSSVGYATRLLVTHDGGATWSPVHLPVPADPTCQCVSAAPVVFDSAKAMVVTPGDGDTVGAGLLMTSDGGRTWSPRTLPVTAPSAVDFLDPTHGWAVDVRDLYRTDDGGLTWSLVRPPMPFNWTAAHVGDLYFVDPQHGFAEDFTAVSTYLVKTIDGGKTWTVVGAMPPRGY